MRARLPPPLYGLVFAFFMWSFETTFPLFYWMPEWARVLAWLPTVIGGAILMLALVQFVMSKTTPDPFHPERASRLVISGVYHYSRNPMYFGMLMLLVGWAIYLGNFSALLLLPAFMWILTSQQIKFEEAALKARFGDEYEAYLTRVRRWI